MPPGAYRPAMVSRHRYSQRRRQLPVTRPPLLLRRRRRASRDLRETHRGLIRWFVLDAKWAGIPIGPCTCMGGPRTPGRAYSVKLTACQEPDTMVKPDKGGIGPIRTD